MKRTVLLAAIAMALSATGAQAAMNKKQAADAIVEAVNATIAAQKMRGEWRDTYKTIGKAKKAYKAGKYDEAAKLANKAKKQGEMGQTQAKAEAGAGIPDYVYAGAGMKK
jgi:hypothetical protein